MDRESSPQPAGAYLKDLTVVFYQGKTLVGVLAEKTKETLVLVDTIELRFQMTDPARGAVGVMPAPLLPAQGPVRLHLPFSAHYTAETDADLIRTYEMMTARRSILLPGLFGA